MPADADNRATLETRWQQNTADIAESAAHRIVPERLRMTDCEIALLAEQDGIEFDLGMTADA